MPLGRISFLHSSKAFLSALGFFFLALNLLATHPINVKIIYWATRSSVPAVNVTPMGHGDVLVGGRFVKPEERQLPFSR